MADKRLERDGVKVNAMRIKAFPFTRDVASFCAMHERVFVVEQNRDAQLRTLLINEGEIDPAKLIKVLNYDGSPITARFIAGAIAGRMAGAKIVPLRKAAP